MPNPATVLIVATVEIARRLQKELQNNEPSLVVAIIPHDVVSSDGCWTELGKQLDKILRDHERGPYELTTFVSGSVGGAIAGHHYQWHLAHAEEFPDSPDSRHTTEICEGGNSLYYVIRRDGQEIGRGYAGSYDDDFGDQDWDEHATTEEAVRERMGDDYYELAIANGRSLRYDMPLTGQPMPGTIIITKCEEQGDHPTHKEFLVVGTVDGQAFSVTVMPFASEYDYEVWPKNLPEGDETLQIAIGGYFERNNISIGQIGR
jgi:hypothetical protein